MHNSSFTEEDLTEDFQNQSVHKMKQNSIILEYMIALRCITKNKVLTHVFSAFFMRLKLFTLKMANGNR